LNTGSQIMFKAPSLSRLSKPIFLLVAGLVFTSLCWAGTVYKTIDANGKTVYSDQAPAKESKSNKTLNFADLPSSAVPESITRYRKELEKSMQARLAAPRHSSSQPILFSADWCGYCKKAKAYLAAKQINYQEYDIDTEAGKQAFVESVGGGGIPVLLRNGQKTQGFSAAAYDAVFNVAP